MARTLARHATTRSPRSPRWDLLGRYQVRVDGRLMLDRLRLVQTPLFAILVTRILEPDPGRDPHDHSRSFMSWILRGGYTERVFPRPDARARSLARTDCQGWASDLLRHGFEHRHRRWSAHVMPSRWAHSITHVEAGTLTLVLAGRYRGDWSFWTPDGPVLRPDYG
jgi:hypothetical protein